MMNHRKPVFSTDLEILAILLSDAPNHIKQLTSDVLVSKYHDILLERAIYLYGGDDFRASDTVVHTFATAAKNMSSADPDLLYWLLKILEKQFRVDNNPEEPNIVDLDDDFFDSSWSQGESEPTDFPAYPISDDGTEELDPINEILSRRLSTLYKEDY